MNTFLRFFYEFISVFFDGFVMIFQGLFNGIIKMFNISEYTKVIDSYKGAFNGAEWLMVVVAVIFLLAVLALLGLLIFFIVLMIHAPAPQCVSNGVENINIYSERW